MSEKKQRNAGLTRRQILSGGIVAGSAAAFAGQGSQAHTIEGEMPWEPGEANAPSPISPGPMRFFTSEEAEFIDAAVSRLIPKDDLGPGASEAGVPTFLDRQLAGVYGRAEQWYMQGPWSEGKETQGYQSRYTPAQLYRAAIKAIDKHCADTLGGKRFSELSSDQQDDLLKKLEKGSVKLEGVDAKTFFTLFLQNTLEGYFSDPIYGGNRDMAAWKMIGFPGARYDYRPWVSKHGQKLDFEPVSISGRPGWDPHA